MVEYKVATKYEDSIYNLVEEFTKLYYINKDWKCEYDDNFSILWDWETGYWPIEINDRYFSIDDLHITLKNNIPFDTLDEFFDKCMEANNEDKSIWQNLIGFHKMKIHKEFQKKINILDK